MFFEPTLKNDTTLLLLVLLVLLKLGVCFKNYSNQNCGVSKTNQIVWEIFLSWSKETFFFSVYAPTLWTIAASEWLY